MIFGAELLSKVLAGDKTVTRRRSPKRVGGIYTVQPGRGKKGVAQFEVLDCRQVRLGDIDEADAQLEGFASRADFIAYWERLYRVFDPDQMVWRIEFKLISTPRCPECQEQPALYGGRCLECRGKSMV